MADRVINVTVSNVNTKNVTVSSKQVANEISATADSSIYYSQLAKNWAIGEGLIQHEDYSSKTYAGVAQEAAESAQGSADTAQAFVNDFSGVVDNAITEIDGVKTEALTAVTSSKDLALSDISATQSSALTEIGDLKNSSLTEISASSTTVLGNINNVGQNYIDNINATGKGFDNLTQRQITNCLLEVPQRIKYDLTDGVLTIKAGSQVIVPYGTSGGDFTVVGSPTIVDGVASGFSTSNYLTSSNSITINPNNFRLHFEFTTGSDITTPQMIIRSYDGQNAFIIGLQNGKIRLYLQSATTTEPWDITSGILSSNLLTTNTKYNCYLSFNGSVYTLNINGNDWITVESSALIRSSFVLKIGQGMSAEPFLGSIDLKQFSITVDDKVVYRPYIQKGDTFLNDNFKVADTQFADGKFFVWAEVQNDTTRGISGNTTCFLQLGMNDGTFSWYTVASATSGGSTAPTGSALWFDTTNNYAKGYNSGSLNQYTSLPMGIFTLTDGYITSFKHFNGLGYIGLTVWVDKGVKGLIPNGRNEDGTLKNIEFTTPKLATATLTAYTNNNMPFGYNVSTNTVGWSDWLYIQEEKPSDNYSHWYKPSENVLYYAGATAGDYKPINILICGFLERTNGVVTEWNPKEAFHAVDYNEFRREVDGITASISTNTSSINTLNSTTLKLSDKATITQWAMPSSKIETLTLGASGTRYTAPADGWFVVNIKVSTDYPFVAFYSRVDAKFRGESDRTSSAVGFIPVAKGVTCDIYYSNNATIVESVFQFVYAEGVK